MDSSKNNNSGSSNNNNNNNFECDTMQRSEEDFTRTAFEYSFPTNDDDDTESNKSTPYFTPMEFLQSPFEFPTPRLADTEKMLNSCTSTNVTATVTAAATSTTSFVAQPTNNELEHLPVMMQSKETETDKLSPRIMQSCSKPIIKHLEPSSPNIQKKFRRFSLYERRSCSPQHLILKNASSVECTVDTNKENTKPKFKMDKNDENKSGNNSPSLILDENDSPRILTSSEAAMLTSGRLTYSPKLLTSINNLHLTSPLGVISSAGYKNGNYFKFPEIDHVVQDVQAQRDSSTVGDDSGTFHKDNQMIKRLGTKNASLPSPEIGYTKIDPKDTSIRDLCSTTATSAILPKTETKRNRKNKNNLTIKIIQNSSSSAAVQPQQYFNTTTAQGKLPSSPSSNKPKTPTIKSTKEKALSLDSAPIAKDCSKTTRLKPELNLSCDEIDSSLHENKQTFKSHDRLRTNLPNSRSTSLSQLAAHKSNVVGKMNKATIRRRIPNSTSADWQLHQRKHTSFNIPDITKKMCENRDDKAVVILKEDEVLRDSQSSFSGLQTSSSINCASNPSTHRTPFKHNPLLHNSNTNLKTLPEFLTLVEFSTPGGGHADAPFKQKSMDLPNATDKTAQVKAPNSSSSSTNLLQRRGSNHSLTLNLHGSCSNLLGSCRSGLSVSNYSLGSVGNSAGNLNSKSSCNLNVNTSQNSQITNIASVNATQGAKQSLFRRRGSNQSLTLTNLTATSCGNLNSFASQNSLNVERAQLTTQPRTIAHASLGATPRRGLLERRGSNQSLTLNMSCSFGGIGSEKGILGNSSMNLGEAKPEEEIKSTYQSLASNCSIHSHQRRFFSSESLNRNNIQFSDLSQAHKTNVNQVCFGSVSNLKPNELDASNRTDAGRGVAQPEHFDFQESSVCTCTGVRNIMTKPLSPQTTSEEFKIYLANIQMLQNASNALNQNDLIKLNFIFDNSYASNSKSISEQTIPILSIPAANKEAETPPALISTSEDFEIIERYLRVVREVLQSLQLDDEEQKRMFRSLHKEFWDLPLNHQEKPMVFGSQTKNRYKTILPNENSRVILEKESKQLIEMIQNFQGIEEDSISELTKQISTSDEVPYINANYIKGPDYTSKCYIATQGPLPNTIYEFWLMVYQNTKKYIEISKGPESPSYRQGKTLQQYYQKIVMLTNFIENNRQKCSVYFPVDLNEIFISTSKDEVVQPSDSFTDFINNMLKSNLDDDDIAAPKNKCLQESTQMIVMDTIKVLVEPEFESQLPHCSNFFVIKNVGIVRKNGFSIRKLIILYCVKFTEIAKHLMINKFLCYHYWYPDWPDHRSPRDINTLLDISLHLMNLGKCEAEFGVFRDEDSTPTSHVNAQSVELYQQDIFNAVQPLPLIHCSAGIGRTGCLIAILNGIRQVRQSLAYSLTTMATNAAKQATASQALSPVDFRLPKLFLEEISLLESPLPTDIDCSFTRNTLLYIRYILQMEKKINERDTTTTNSDLVDALWVLPSLAELPKMSNIFVDILGIVCNLRLQRGGMVQNSEQYELIHRAVCLYLKRAFALKRF